ncbi:MAG TPA: hypothetical protein VMN03_11645 [Burkholderiales bacterium]|nr:hypothetical protein [Burkholderiales bacterium]
MNVRETLAALLAVAMMSITVSLYAAEQPPASPVRKSEPIYGYRMMSNDERNDYRKRMREARSAQERQAIRDEHRKLMESRAKERGVTLPERRGPGAGPMSGRPGAGMGQDEGPRGAGKGPGMGPGPRWEGEGGPGFGKGKGYGPGGKPGAGMGPGQGPRGEGGPGMGKGYGAGGGPRADCPAGQDCPGPGAGKGPGPRQ